MLSGLFYLYFAEFYIKKQNYIHHLEYNTVFL